MESLGIVLQALSVWAMPALDRRRCPICGLVAVAVVAGVGRSELRRNIRPWHPEAVIVPPIDHHIGARRHVTRRAGQRRIDGPMSMMRGHRILVGGVTLQAGVVGGSAKLAAVRLVAVAAGDADREHLALLERTVVIDLIQHLTVGVIKTLA